MWFSDQEPENSFCYARVTFGTEDIECETNFFLQKMFSPYKSLKISSKIKL